MSIIHLNHIQGEILRNTRNFLDFKEFERLPEQEKLNHILSQGFCLYTLKSITNLEYTEISDSITDGFNDFGIDCLFWDRRTNIFYIIQSKWIKSANGGIEKGEILKFLEGIKKLLTFDFEGFNEKIKNKKKDINEAFLNNEVKVKIIASYTGNTLSAPVLDSIKSFLDEFNDPEEVIFFEEFNLRDAHRCLTLGLDGKPINANIDIVQWGKNDDPVKVIYGQINCMFYVDVFKNHKLRLFSQNIRGFMGESDINSEIIKSLLTDPSSFFYFNNGITILTKKMQKSAYGGNDRSTGHFLCEDITIINGAQTVGSIYEAYKLNPEQIGKAFVFTRIISLENCPKDFERKVTVATNTQNKIEKKDFVSLEPEQIRLKTELLLDNIHYHIKRDGTIVKKDLNNFDLEEATIVLACLHPNVELSVLAKREISKLWEDTTKPPYKTLFNESLTSQKLYKCVLIYRKIEKQINSLKWESSDIHTPIVTHGSYLVFHLVFQSIEKTLINNPKIELSQDKFLIVEEITKLTIEKVIKEYTRIFKGKFPPTVFKNANYVRLIKEGVLDEDGKILPGHTYDLFD